MPPSKIAYQNLRIEMAKKNILISDIAKCLDIRVETAGRKLARKRKLTLPEAFKITSTFFSDHSVEDLFAEDFKDGDINASLFN